jgi:hypothetical protein
MTTWTDWENPTLEEIAACIPDHQREILGHSWVHRTRYHHQDHHHP